MTKKTPNAELTLQRTTQRSPAVARVSRLYSLRPATVNAFFTYIQTFSHILKILLVINLQLSILVQLASPFEERSLQGGPTWYHRVVQTVFW